MKKKLALLMAAIMTVAMVPMTAFAETKLTVATNIKTGVGDDYPFTSLVELKNDNSSVSVTSGFSFRIKLTNGEFVEGSNVDVGSTGKDDSYAINDKNYLSSTIVSTDSTNGSVTADEYIYDYNVINDTTAIVTLQDGVFEAGMAVVIPIYAYAVDEGDVVARIWSNATIQFDDEVKIATAYSDDVTIESDGIVTFVEDSSENVKKMKGITITGLYAGSISGNSITLKLKGNYEFAVDDDYTGETNTVLVDASGTKVTLKGTITLLNDTTDALGINKGSSVSSDKIVYVFDDDVDATQITEIYISGIYIKPTKSCEAGDVAKLTISSKDFSSVTLEVAKMVEEAVTYSVEDDDLPTIWAGKDYAIDDEYEDDTNTLELYVEENTGDILNTSRKATFTFPDGIEVVAIDIDLGDVEDDFKWEIDENVVTIWNYSSGSTESSDETDFGISFLINAAPTFEGDVDVTLGREFDDVEFTIATVQAPYTVEAKTSEVLIDYRYVPVNEIVITEAEEEILKEGDVIILGVEKMDFEDAGTYEVTEGDIEVDVSIDEAPDFDEVDSGSYTYLIIEVTDESTEASTITISGLELYLDRTLPVGGYALKNIGAWDVDNDHSTAYDSTSVTTYKSYVTACNILWENSTTNDDIYDADEVTGYATDSNGNSKDDPSDILGDGMFKYSALVCNDSYVEVVTAARDQDDSTTSRKIVITIGATTMTVGTETVTLDAPAYINSEDYTMLPVRAISEAFGATVTWDDASKTVTVLSGQRIISMTIGSKTMYINGTPVAMNTAAEITNDRTFIPVRDLANSLGISAIDWNEASATVTLN